MNGENSLVLILRVIGACVFTAFGLYMLIGGSLVVRDNKLDTGIRILCGTIAVLGIGSLGYAVVLLTGN